MRFVLLLPALALCTAASEVRIRVVTATPTESRIALIRAGAGLGGDACGGTTVHTGGKEPLALPIAEKCFCKDERAGAVVAARGHGMTFVKSAELCNRPAGEAVEVKPGAGRPVEVHIFPRNEELLEAARDEVGNLDWILDRNFAGITLKPVYHPGERDEAVFRDIVCENALKLGKPIPGKLNVFYGVGGAETTGLSGGERCDVAPVLINDLPVLGDLAHELGHSLGLRGPDHAHAHDQGHAVARGAFNCNNAMVPASDVLKDQLSFGQAIWMNFSCLSVAADPESCLKCSERRGAKSGCPLFEAGQAEAKESGELEDCRACSVANARKFRDDILKGGRVDGSAVRIIGDDRAVMCSRASVHLELAERFRQLKAHVAGRDDLALGAATQSRFVSQWEGRIGVKVAIEATAWAMETGAGDMVDGMVLMNQWRFSSEYAASEYLQNSMLEMMAGTYVRGCARTKRRGK